MANDLMLYLKDLQKKYGEDTEIIPKNNHIAPDKIPLPLQSLYSTIEKVKLPFGQIYSVEKALEQSKNAPFSPNWFVFGKDCYFSFWLCSFDEDEDGLSFTSWDHDNGSEIGEAAFETVLEFLQDAEEEYDEEQEDGEEE